MKQSFSTFIPQSVSLPLLRSKCFHGKDPSFEGQDSGALLIHQLTSHVMFQWKNLVSRGVLH